MAAAASEEEGMDALSHQAEDWREGRPRAYGTLSAGLDVALAFCEGARAEYKQMVSLSRASDGRKALAAALSSIGVLCLSRGDAAGAQAFQRKP